VESETLLCIEYRAIELVNTIPTIVYIENWVKNSVPPRKKVSVIDQRFSFPKTGHSHGFTSASFLRENVAWGIIIGHIGIQRIWCFRKTEEPNEEYT
jgi:hypothetical protein